MTAFHRSPLREGGADRRLRFWQVGPALSEDIRAFHDAGTVAQLLIIAMTVMAVDIASLRLRKSLV